MDDVNRDYATLPSSLAITLEAQPLSQTLENARECLPVVGFAG